MLQRQLTPHEGRTEYLLYRFAKALFVDNYFNLMRRGMERLQEFEGPLLDGSADGKIYREVARPRRQLNPFERSLMHVGEFVGTVVGANPDIPAAFRYLSGNIASDQHGSRKSSRCSATEPRS